MVLYRHFLWLTVEHVRASILPRLTLELLLGQFFIVIKTLDLCIKRVTRELKMTNDSTDRGQRLSNILHKQRKLEDAARM